MVVVAIAGGTSPGLGRAILTALKQHTDHTPVVLSRATSNIPQWLVDLGVEVRKVDYQSDESLVTALKGVHTLICTLLAQDGTWAEKQIALLNAGIKAGIRRFAPSEFGCGYLAAAHIDLLSPLMAVLEACREAKAKTPQFEWAGFRLGLFMNYLGNGAKNEAEALAGKNDDGLFVWNVKDMKADIPLTEDGAVPRITMTEIGDVGRFVAAACNLQDGLWEEDMGMVGWTGRMDEVVTAVERARGRKMEVSYRSAEKVRHEIKEATEPWPLFWLQLEEMYTRNREGEGVVAPVLNRLCPEVKPITMEEYVQKFWSSY